VPVRSAPSEALESAPWTDPVRSSRFGPSVWHRILGRSQRRKWLPWALAATILCVAIGTILLARVLERPAANDLFTRAEAWRVAAIAREKELPVPGFEIARVDSDLPAELRRFLGIWVSGGGFVNSRRQLMLIVTNVEKSGILSGISVLGPRQPLSVGKALAGATHFKARVSGDAFTYSRAASECQVTLLEGGQLEFVETWEESSARGLRARVVLDPVWTLVEGRASGGGGNRQALKPQGTSVAKRVSHDRFVMPIHASIMPLSALTAQLRHHSDLSDCSGTCSVITGWSGGVLATHFPRGAPSD
jgi:hypothetical protein